MLKTKRQCIIVEFLRHTHLMKTCNDFQRVILEIPLQNCIVEMLLEG